MELDERAKKIRLVVLDVDGVLTDGGLYFGPEGEVQKRFHVRDGAGIKRLLAAGIEVAVISGRASAATQTRLAELGVSRFWLGREDKWPVFEALLEDVGCDTAEVACMGDDLADAPLLDVAGIAAAPADAIDAVQARAHFVSKQTGGNGAVRELCDFLLAAQSPDA